MEEPLNYYQLLGLEEKHHAAVLSSQEVKAAYRRALLQHHPDKKVQTPSFRPTKNGEKSPVTVDEIALAYKVLSEPVLRAEYNRWLQTDDSGEDANSRVHRTGLETVDLDDLVFDPASSLWSRSCRCGDDSGFLVTEAELEKNAEDGELFVGCKGCSLWLRVLFGVEE
jgi:diphthamide biosynthesis protein 4